MLTRHAAGFPQQPHDFDLLVTEVFLIHVHALWPCHHSCQPHHQSLRLLSWYSSSTIRIVVDLPKSEKNAALCQYQRSFNGASLPVVAINYPSIAVSGPNGGYGGLFRCSAFHQCTTWTIPCIVPLFRSSVAFLNMPVAMLLTLSKHVPSFSILHSHDIRVW